MKRAFIAPPLIFLLPLLFLSSGAMAEDSNKLYKYCFKVHFLDPEQIESATVTGYDHPWYKLFQPKEIHRKTFTSYTDRHCWKSELPEMGIGMRYVVINSGQGTNDFRCRKAPDPLKKYKAKTWNLVIRRKQAGEEYPIDCRIE